MYTGVNEFEECRLQALTLTKSLDFVESSYKNLATGLEAHGHPPTQLMYTDNAQNELAYHERTTQSLQENVSHITINPFEHLPLLLLFAGTNAHSMKKVTSLMLLVIICSVELN